MILHIHSDCVYTRYGISDLARNFLNNSNHNETIHVFDLSRNSHPLELSKRVKIAQQQSIGPICKIIVICDESTALLLRQYNIMCISKSESIMNWVGFFAECENVNGKILLTFGDWSVSMPRRIFLKMMFLY